MNDYATTTYEVHLRRGRNGNWQAVDLLPLPPSQDVLDGLSALGDEVLGAGSYGTVTATITVTGATFPPRDLRLEHRP